MCNSERTAKLQNRESTKFSSDRTIQQQNNKIVVPWNRRMMKVQNTITVNSTTTELRTKLRNYLSTKPRICRIPRNELTLAQLKEPRATISKRGRTPRKPIYSTWTREAKYTLVPAVLPAATGNSDRTLPYLQVLHVSPEFHDQGDLLFLDPGSPKLFHRLNKVTRWKTCPLNLLGELSRRPNHTRSWLRVTNQGQSGSIFEARFSESQNDSESRSVGNVNLWFTDLSDEACCRIHR